MDGRMDIEYGVGIYIVYCICYIDIDVCWSDGDIVVIWWCQPRLPRLATAQQPATATLRLQSPLFSILGAQKLGAACRRIRATR
jgi:hypothetical protein